MKIVKQGKAKDIYYYAVCDDCGCEVELTEEEFEAIPIRCGFYAEFYSRSIKCPTEGCGQMMDAKCGYR